MDGVGEREEGGPGPGATTRAEDDATETETAKGNAAAAAAAAAENAGEEEVDGQQNAAGPGGNADGKANSARKQRDPDGPMTAQMAALQALREAVRPRAIALAAGEARLGRGGGVHARARRRVR